MNNASVPLIAACTVGRKPSMVTGSSATRASVHGSAFVTRPGARQPSVRIASADHAKRRGTRAVRAHDTRDRVPVSILS
jgi:hypothetical protein